MIRAVFDANVWISAALARHPEAPAVQILDAAIDGRVYAITSPRIIGEVASVLRRERLRRFISLDEALRFVDNLAGLTRLTPDAPEPHPELCRDPRDDYLIALALSVSAEALVSGDDDVLELSVPGLKIVPPRPFLDLIAES